MPNKRKSVINIKAIQQEYLLSFVEVLTIARNEQWKVITLGRGVNYDRQTVKDYFDKQGIAPKTITYKGIMERYKITKEKVFEILGEQRFAPVSTAGALWTFDFAKIDGFFKNNTD